MNVAVVVPAFGLGQEPSRRRGFELVQQHLAGLGWPIVTPPGPSPAVARNRGAASRPDVDVVVFNDADTLVPLEQIRVAASLAADAPGLVFAFTEYRRLGQAVTGLVDTADAAFTVPAAESYQAPPSHGCVAIRRVCFEQVGGYDERLEVFEDCALNVTCEVRWAARRVAGPAVHLWHPRLGEVGDPAFEQRHARSRRLWEAEYPVWVPPPVTADV